MNFLKTGKVKSLEQMIEFSKFDKISEQGVILYELLSESSYFARVYKGFFIEDPDEKIVVKITTKKPLKETPNTLKI